MNLLSLMKTGLTSLYQSIKRFPLTIILSAITTALLIAVSRVYDGATQNALSRLAMAAALGIPLTLSLALAYERRRPAKTVEIASYGLALGLLVLYRIFLLPEFTMVPVTRYIAVSIALYLTFLFVPYFFQRRGFELYVIKVISRFLVTAIYSAVLFGGLAITLLTIDLLLGIEVTSVFYANVWMVVAGIFAPCSFLAGLPGADWDSEQETYPSLLRVLLLYIVIPLILTYTSILYIYFLKTLVTLEWPKGTVSHLVLWYSVFSAGVIFLIHPLIRESKFARFFTVWFPKLVLPALAMMFIAIGVRINAYGVTENRYFVVALGLWVLGIMIYYSLAKQFRNIILPISLALVALLTVVGPWSAYSVSKYSQNARLEAIAAEYNMVKDASLQKPDRDITKEDQKRIVSILDYFADSHSLQAVPLLPSGFDFTNMEEVFGFSRKDVGLLPGQQTYFRHYTQVKTLDVQGYDHLLRSAGLESPVTVADYTVQYFPEDKEITVLRGDQEIYRMNLKTFAGQVVESHGADFLEVPAEDMTFLHEQDDLRVKLVFTGISGNTEPDGQWTKLNIQELEFYLLLGTKK